MKGLLQTVSAAIKDLHKKHMQKFRICSVPGTKNPACNLLKNLRWGFSVGIGAAGLVDLITASATFGASLLKPSFTLLCAPLHVCLPTIANGMSSLLDKFKKVLRGLASMFGITFVPRRRRANGKLTEAQKEEEEKKDEKEEE